MTAATPGSRGSGSPIALFAYNRPHHLAKCLASIAANPEAHETPLYLFLDGPRTEEDAPLVALVAEMARSAAESLQGADRGTGLSRSTGSWIPGQSAGPVRTSPIMRCAWFPSSRMVNNIRADGSGVHIEAVPAIFPSHPERQTYIALAFPRVCRPPDRAVIQDR